jgi:isochorismate hydrolase
MKDLQASQGSLLNRADALLVVIDMQERLLPVIAEKERVVENVLKLVKFAPIIGLPVIHTEQQNLGETISEIRAALQGVDAIIKLEFDCFKSPIFAEHIRRLKRNTLIITGVEAHICVAQTALHALADHTVHVVSDAISSRSSHNHKVALGRMGNAGVTITSTEMVIYELLEKAGTDQFREALKLVK